MHNVCDKQIDWEMYRNRPCARKWKKKYCLKRGVLIDFSLLYTMREILA